MTSFSSQVSSKGQVVIPEVIRKTLGLENGCQFLVLGEKDAVILKTITARTVQIFIALAIFTCQGCKKLSNSLKARQGSLFLQHSWQRVLPEEIFVLECQLTTQQPCDRSDDGNI